MTVTAPAPLLTAVLGPVEVRREGRDLDLGAPRQRAVVAALALSAGRPVAVDTLVDLVWGERPPPAVSATLQGYVSHLRRAVEPDRERRTPAGVLVTVAPGYAWRAPVDAGEFERAVTQVHSQVRTSDPTLAPALAADALEGLLADLSAAVERWRGTPYAELGDAPAAVAERARLEELLLIAREDQAVAGLALGRHQTVAADLEALIHQHPLRERLWTLRAVALTRAGRQSEALEQLRRLREVLDEELGLEPSPEARTLQALILRQDASLAWSEPRQEVRVPGPRRAVDGADAPTSRPVAPWPMVGREAELAALVAHLERAQTGAPACAVLTGDPGIGKTRLVAELARLARAAGAQVLVGRCSQDDGAPPLWPWKHVLEGAGESLEARIGGESGGQFLAWERVTDAVLTAARERPTLVVLDDLHWADPSTLRVLRLLLERSADERLLLVATWRRHPEPAGDLAAAADALARAHALRLELGGLGAEQVADVVGAVTRVALSGDDAERLRERTDGNPFFLVEYARLAAERDLSGVLAEEHPPTAVSEVVARRVGQLPAESVSLLRVAAVVGRSFDGSTVARAAGVDEESVLDRLEPALEAGLLREDGVDRYRFAHALVCDGLRASTPASRRARTHARVATVLDGVAGRETEVARHWGAAGPSYAAKAWRSAVGAARLARRLQAYDEEAAFLRDALAAHGGDPDATPRERYDLLLELVDACRWAADLPGLVGAMHDAISVGQQLDDPPAIARAAISANDGTLWRSAPPGATNETVVEALRSSLACLPEGDGDLRCRTLVTLAHELRESAPLAHRAALVDDGLAMARRLGEPGLLLQILLGAFVALWLPDNAEVRLQHASEAATLAERTGRDRALVVATCLRAAALSELGRRAELDEALASGRGHATRTGILFGAVILDSVEAPWLAMSGDDDGVEACLERLRRNAAKLDHVATEGALDSALISVRRWQGRDAEVVELLEEYDEDPTYPFAATLTAALWRAGEHDRARLRHAHGIELVHDNEVSLLEWCAAGEVALLLGDADLGRGSAALLTPLFEQSAAVGSTFAGGPVAGYLAMALAAAGRRREAAQYADRAIALARAWRIPRYGAWLDEHRRSQGF